MMRSGNRLRLWGPLVAALGSAAAMPAIAAPLDAPACEQLQLRLDALRQGGVEADMALGPAAAKATLSPDRLNRIGAFIEIEEQLNFRCGLAKQRIVLPTTVEGGEEEVPAPGEAAVEGATGTMPLPQRPPRAVKDAAAGDAAAARKPAKKANAPASPSPGRKPAVAKAKEKETAGPASGAPQAKPAPRPAKKKPAAKVDDAYRPPAKPAAREQQAEPAAKQ